MTNIARVMPQTQTAQTRTTSGVTELVLTSDSPEQLSLLLPMIAYLSNSAKDRWITWIAPHNISKDFLESYGVNTRFIRVIHAQDPQALLWITWEALSAGNSHTVISSPGKLSDKELSQLEVAAAKGQCQGLLLRVR
uniref:cell division inhibitor SulA n=1 Tax=Cellvibrio fontiphilus TaxID=1815559 RepID=UPI002B4BA745|nr:SulA-like leucine-rich domain-containing protein [Cellvibrio fontiphilus]